MKKVLFFLCLAAFFYNANSQTTYYWVGGNGPITFTGTSRWNTALNGSGTPRTVADTTDILIFDGSNVGGNSPKTGSVSTTITSTKIGQLKLINNANLILSRPTGGGTGTLAITGGVGEDFVVEANSSFTINSIADSGAVSFLIQLGATGLVSGNVTITNTATNRMVVQSAGALVFDGTSNCTVSTQPATSSYPFGSNTQSVEKGVVFLAGSKLTTTGRFSPMGGTSTYMAIDFRKGSNYYIRSSNAPSTGSWMANKIFGNVFIQNGATLTADGSIGSIENLTIDNGCSFITHTSGQTPIIGNLVANGIYSGPVGTSTNVLVMGGNSLQTISGSVAITPPAFTVGDNSSVLLSNNIVTTGTTTSSIAGKLDFSTNSFSGTSPFFTRVGSTAAAVTGNITAGSIVVSGVVGTLSGNTGLTIQGAGIPANTNVIAFSTSNSILYLSQPATTTATAVALTFESKSATLTTAHPFGFDSTLGCVTTTGQKSFASGTNYVVNAATTKPIGLSTTAINSMTVGNLTLNAPTTTCINTRVNGTLTLNNGIFSIRPTDTLRIFNGNDIAGGSFSSSKYVATIASSSNVGVLRIDTISTTKFFPVGTATNYLPVEITPSDNSNFSVSVFNGLTNDGTVTGTPFNATQQSSTVAATWIINRTKGTGNSDINFNWQNSLEGTDFSNYSNSEIGIANYDALATSWAITTATNSDNKANTASASFGSFGSFGIGKLGEVLPVKFNKINAIVNNKDITINWVVANEIGIDKYLIERSIDGRTFTTVGTVLALNNITEKQYSFINKDVAIGNYYYRILVQEKNGKNYYSNLVKISTESKVKLSLYPNPASKVVMLSGLAQGSTIQIIDIAGRVVNQINTNNQFETINVSNLTKGLWFVKVLTTNGLATTTSFIKN
jgi:trimeric autotransporter adhesin